MRVVLLGAPGAGKGTQAASVGEALNVPHIATGDLFRTAVSQKTALGLEAKTFMDRGELVPDRVTISMLLERVSEEDAGHGYVLDGFPRTVAQAVALDGLLGSRMTDVDRVLVLKVPDTLIVERIVGRRVCRENGHPFHVKFRPSKTEGTCDVCGSELYQRADDTEAKVLVRLNEYAHNTAPVAAYFERRGIVREIDGVGDIDAIYGRLMAALEK